MKKAKRVLPVRRKVKQLDWIMAWFVRVFPCAFCGRPLSEGYNPRDPGKCITLHHTEGCREEDDWDDIEYVKKMVPAHCSCHREYHQRLRLSEAGRNVNMDALRRMQKSVQVVLSMVQEKLG